MALARADGAAERLKRKDYYSHLERQQRGAPEITKWLEWFLNCLKEALINAESTLSHVLHKASLWERISQQSPINDRQRGVLERMLDEKFKGYMNSSKYAKLAKCSTDTALRDIKDLVKRGILVQNPGGGRSTNYRLNDLSNDTTVGLLC